MKKDTPRKEEGPRLPQLSESLQAIRIALSKWAANNPRQAYVIGGIILGMLIAGIGRQADARATETAK